MQEKGKFWLTLGLMMLVFSLGCWWHAGHGYFNRDALSLQNPGYILAAHAEGADDAYISYRYGWTLAHTGLWSWNESGYRRVEGFTNPLWVIMSAGWSLLGEKSWIYPLMASTSVVFTLLGLWVLARAVFRAQEGTASALVGLLLFAATPVVWLHAASGLESAVFGVWLALVAYLAVETKVQVQGWLLGLLVGLLCWLRSDGFVYVGVVLAGAVLAHSLRWRPVLIGLLVGQGLLTAWRWLVFGALVPNTTLAKLNFSLWDRLPVGWAILVTILVTSGLTAFVLGLVLAGRYTARRAWLGWVLMALGWVGYYLFIGGDTYVERHLIGLMALAAAASGAFWRLAARRQQIWVGLLMLVLVAAPLLVGDARFSYWAPKQSDLAVLLGRALGQERDRYGVLISWWGGKVPFYAGGDCIDLWGLNDADLALVRGESFFPGHSAGSWDAARKLGQASPQQGMTLVMTWPYNREQVQSPEEVVFWVDRLSPEPGLERGLTAAQWQTMLKEPLLSRWAIVALENK